MCIRSGLKKAFPASLFMALCLVSGAMNNAYAGKFYIPETQSLPEVELYEIGLSQSGISSGLSAFEADASWTGNDLNTPMMQLDEIYTTTTIVRKNVLLWYYTYNQKAEREPVFNVRYRVLSRSGKTNTLSHQTDSASLITATITEKPLDYHYKNKNVIRCLGIVDMDFDISRATRSGKYYGTIEITITSY